MFNYQWFYQGVVQDIIDGRTLNLWVDLGFYTWRTIQTRFNRLKVFLPSNPAEKTKTVLFLENSLKRKKVFIHVIRKKDYYGTERFFTEVYINQEDFLTPNNNSKIEMSLRDINRALITGNRPSGSVYKIDGLLNINDYLVKEGLAEYVDFSKPPLRNGPPRRPEQVPQNINNSQETGNSIDTSGSRPATEGEAPSRYPEEFRPRFFKKVFNRVQDQ
jgi:hypothetical protein